MARYIDADLLTETMRNRYDEICDTYGYHDLYASGYDDAVDAVENAPTADVAPRVEVAREVFEEIRDLIRFTMEPNSTILYAKIEFEKLEELKKKYTGGD